MTRLLVIGVLTLVIACAFIYGTVEVLDVLVPRTTPESIEPVPPEVRIYKLMYPGSGIPDSYWQGTRITNDGMCSTIWLNYRADTIICGAHLLTETVPEGPRPPALHEEGRSG